MRRIFLLFFAVILCFAFSYSVSAADAEVINLTAEVLVSDDGTSSITLTTKVHFLTSPKKFTIPLAAEADDIQASGASYETDDIGGVECVIFKSKSGFSGEMTFVTTYRVAHCVREADSGQQTFSLGLPEKGWDFPIEKFDLSVTFPAEVTAMPSWYSAYHGVDIENYLDISIDGTTLKASSFERFKDRETVSVELVFEAQSFNLRHLPGQTVSFMAILFWLVLLGAVVYWFFRLRSKLPRATLRQSAVNEATAGELPCQLFGTAPDLVGILAHWGNLGYLTITRGHNERIVLRKKMEMGSERAALERKLFYSIFNGTSAVDATDQRVHSLSKRVGQMLCRHWNRRLFRKNSGNPFVLRLLALVAGLFASIILFDLMLPANLLRWFLLPVLTVVGTALFFIVQLAVLRFYSRHRLATLLGGLAALLLLFLLSLSAGCFGIIFMAVVLQIFCAIVTMFGGVREKSAFELLQQILGLRSFLRSIKRDDLVRLMRADSQYFYRMLPMAEQLGIASAFAKRCGSIRLGECPWLIDSEQEPHSSAEFAALYANIAAAIRNEPSLSQIVKHTEVHHG